MQEMMMRTTSPSVKMLQRHRELPPSSYEVIKLPNVTNNNNINIISPTSQECDQQHGVKRQKAMPSVASQPVEFPSKLDGKYPSFSIPVLKCHVTQWFWMGIPQAFCRMHLPLVDTYFLLENESGKQYKVEYIAERTSFSGGWRKFSSDEKLSEGEVLVFQLVDSTKFKVHRKRASGLSEVNGARTTLNLDASVERSGAYIAALEQNMETRRASSFEAASRDTNHTVNVYEEGEIVQIVENVEENTLSSGGSNHAQSPPAVSDSNGITSFDKFMVAVDNALKKEIKDFTLPEHIKWTYYQLCSSQKSILHSNLLKGINPVLRAGCIVEIVNIAIELKSCELSTFDNGFSMWDQRLKSLENLGMDVRFLSGRLLHLQKLASNSETAKIRQQHVDLSSKFVDSQNTIKSLEDQLTEKKRAHEKLTDDKEKLETALKEQGLRFREEVTAPW